MTATIDFGYDYVFGLASQLLPEEQEQLLRELPKNAPLKLEWQRESFLPDEDDGKPYCLEEFYEFLLRGPVIDEEQIQLMLEAREVVNKCRPISW